MTKKYIFLIMYVVVVFYVSLISKADKNEWFWIGNLFSMPIAYYRSKSIFQFALINTPCIWKQENCDKMYLYVT